jgi:peroxiredoxin
MKKLILSSLMALIAIVMIHAEGQPGKKAVGFSLKNVDGTTVSLSDYSDQQGVILVFTCNPCPYSKAYEQRIIQLHKDYADKGFPVVAINPNDELISTEDTFESMVKLAGEKDYPFPYLKDESQEVYKAYGATRTPHIFLLTNDGGEFKIAYVGAIDNNAMDASAVTDKYLEKAISAVMGGNTPNPALTKAVGCGIKSQS